MRKLFSKLDRTITSGLPPTRSEYARRERHFSIQLVLPRTVRRRCLGCQECQSRSKTGHSSSAPACDLYAFLVTVQEMNLSILVSVLLLGFLALHRFHRRMVEALA